MKRGQQWLLPPSAGCEYLQRVVVLAAPHAIGSVHVLFLTGPLAGDCGFVTAARLDRPRMLAIPRLPGDHPLRRLALDSVLPA